MTFVLEVHTWGAGRDGNAAAEPGRTPQHWGGNLGHYALKPGHGSVVYDSDYREAGHRSLICS